MTDDGIYELECVGMLGQKLTQQIEVDHDGANAIAISFEPQMCVEHDGGAWFKDCVKFYIAIELSQDGSIEMRVYRRDGIHISAKDINDCSSIDDYNCCIEECEKPITIDLWSENRRKKIKKNTVIKKDD